MDSASPFSWTKENMLQYMTEGADPIISDPLILNAFRVVDRKHFVPEHFSHKAYQDAFIPIAYKEYLPSPIFVAKQLKFFQPKYGGRYLHLGTGTGYTAAILSFISGTGGKVYSLDRIQWMWENARKRIRENLPEINNMEILFRDGETGLPDKAPYDGILFSFIPNTIEPELIEQLSEGGKILAPTSDHSLKIIEKDPEFGLVEEYLPDINTGLINKGKTGLA